MNNETKTGLIGLQEVLYKKSLLEKEISDAPKTLMTNIEVLNKLKKAYVEKNNYLERKTERINRIRERLNDLEVQRNEAEKQMGEIETQREYESLDKKIKEFSAKEQELRLKYNKERQEFDELKSDMTNKENMILTQEKEIESEKEKLESYIISKQAELDSLKGKEKEILPGIGDDIVYKFDRIVRKKEGVAIVPIKNGVCTGCNIMLTPQFVNEVREETTISFCPYCSRILYCEDNEIEQEQAEMKFDDADLGGLSDLNPDVDF